MLYGSCSLASTDPCCDREQRDQVYRIHKSSDCMLGLEYYYEFWNCMYDMLYYLCCSCMFSTTVCVCVIWKLLQNGIYGYIFLNKFYDTLNCI